MDRSRSRSRSRSLVALPVEPPDSFECCETQTGEDSFGYDDVDLGHSRRLQERTAVQPKIDLNEVLKRSAPDSVLQGMRQEYATTFCR